MYRALIILFFLVLGVLHNVDAQDFSHFNNRTLALYEAGNWRELISVGKDALHEGHDFYYLRMRIGIAYYELQNFRLAITQFERALDYNKNDLIANEYLYYSYLFSGQESEALLLANQNEPLLVKVKARPAQVVKSGYTEGGVKIKSDEVDEVGPIYFYHAGISHQISPAVNVYHGYSHLSQVFSTFTEVDTGNGQGPGPGGPGSTTLVEREFTYRQDEYYIRANLRPARGWLFIPAYHYQAFADSLDNYALSFGLVKNVGQFQFYGAFGFSEINESEQDQWTLGVTYYPMGNLNLYLQTNYTLHDEEGRTNTIVYHKIGRKFTGTTWLEAVYGWGEMRNFTEMDAFYVQNIRDVIESRLGVTLIQMIKKKHRLTFGYLRENKKVFEIDESYQHHTLFTGFTLSF